jgi:hypothetical protein
MDDNAGHFDLWVREEGARGGGHVRGGGWGRPGKVERAIGGE